MLPLCRQGCNLAGKKMINKTYCATCVGIDAVTVTVETDLSQGIGIHLVGLPDSAVRESLLRVVTALTAYGFRIPGKKMVFNLAPADIRKEGSAYDLAIALGLLAVSEQAYLPRLADYIVMGELSLDGRVRSVPGVLPVAVHAAATGFKGCIFPADSAREAADMTGIDIYGVNNLAEAIEVLSDDVDVSRLLVHPVAVERTQPRHINDFCDVKGQLLARRGLEIAAAGGHSCLLVGSPGSGKTMMASCLPSILPPMTREESIETSKIYSVAGRRPGSEGLMRERPFRTPHHSASLVSLIGGGSSASPGEISLAHNGVLYLDEMAQFPKALLDALRQPVEDGRVTISRAKYKVEYPARFMLVASMNPCPCGYFGDESGRCNCTPTQVRNYMSRISGPMMDRLDIQIQVRAVSAEELTSSAKAEPSALVAQRVVAARKIQTERFAGSGIFTNSQMNARMTGEFCRIGAAEKKFLLEVIDRLNLSARAYGRILKLARTIADLDGSGEICLKHIAEAVQYRNLDRGGAF